MCVTTDGFLESQNWFPMYLTTLNSVENWVRYCIFLLEGVLMKGRCSTYIQILRLNIPVVKSAMYWLWSNFICPAFCRSQLVAPDPGTCGSAGNWQSLTCDRGWIRGRPVLGPAGQIPASRVYPQVPVLDPDSWTSLTSSALYLSSSSLFITIFFIEFHPLYLSLFIYSFYLL